jgi:hypothetical protein
MIEVQRARGLSEFAGTRDSEHHPKIVPIKHRFAFLQADLAKTLIALQFAGL